MNNIYTVILKNIFNGPGYNYFRGVYLISVANDKISLKCWQPSAKYLETSLASKTEKRPFFKMLGYYTWCNRNCLRFYPIKVQWLLWGLNEIHLCQCLFSCESRCIMYGNAFKFILETPMFIIKLFSVRPGQTLDTSLIYSTSFFIGSFNMTELRVFKYTCSYMSIIDVTLWFT